MRATFLAVVACALQTACGGLVCDASNGCGDPMAPIVVTPPLPDAAPPADEEPFTQRMQLRETMVWQLGDSLTRGEGSTGTVGYRRAFYEWTREQGFSVRFQGTLSGPGTWPNPVHDGATGNSIGQIRELVQRNYAPSYGRIQHVDLILLLVGTNDMDQGTYDKTATASEYAALLDELAAVDGATTIAVSTLPPHEDSKVQAHIDEFNARLPGIWNHFDGAHRTHLVRASLGEALGKRWNKDVFYDAVHPNDAGYDRLDAAWITALTAPR